MLMLSLWVLNSGPFFRHLCFWSTFFCSLSNRGLFFRIYSWEMFSLWSLWLSWSRYGLALTWLIGRFSRLGLGSGGWLNCSFTLTFSNVLAVGFFWFYFYWRMEIKNYFLNFFTRTSVVFATSGNHHPLARHMWSLHWRQRNSGERLRANTVNHEGEINLRKTKVH